MNIEACEVCGASFESHFEAICRACKDSWFASAPDGTLRSALLTIYGWADDDFLGRDEVRNLLKPHLETLRAVAQPQETDEPAPTRPHERALWRIYDLLGELERNLGRRIGTPENARLLHRAIESCKHWKHPEFELKFAAPEDRPEPELQRARFLEWWKSSATQHVTRDPQELAWAAWREAMHVDEVEEEPGAETISPNTPGKA